MHHVAIRIVSFRVVRGVDAHCLLAHRRLVHVARRLVVVGIWYSARKCAQNECRVQLAVRMVCLYFFGSKCNQGMFLLVNGQVLDDA